MAESKKSRSSTPSDIARVDLREVERLLDFMGQHGLEEFEYERENFRVRLKKASHGTIAGPRSALAPEIVVAGASQASAAHVSASREVTGDAGRTEDLHVIKSPIVGTYYQSANPGSEPFVRPGDHVKSGQVLCIIEAMKLMNEIESDIDGEVMRIFVENGQPVEYGEPLFGIHPRRKK